MTSKGLRAWIADLPTTVIVTMTGVFLTIATGTRYLLSGRTTGAPTWEPSEWWLMFLLALMGVNYAVKRLTWKETPPTGSDVEDVPKDNAEK